ncbi:MAG: creatininase family protein [Pyramidobacter sp.]|nr:creatininase family protein [Pyramidobacter sp.]MBQ9422155.1 creatininase family protein [Pyramidobacter sp.]MBR1896626.1 creatininase family protein [Pyramidobacter sp.]
MLMKEMNYVDYRAEVAKTHAMLLPVGAFEVWGPHLPVGADTLVAEDIAERVSKEIGWVVGPSVPVGYSESLFAPEGGTITVRPESLRNYLLDIVESLVETGVNRFCFIGPHLGNVSVITEIGTHLRRTKGVKCCLIDWWRFIQPLCKDVLKYEGRPAHAHAAEAGTSTFMYLRPDLVKTERFKDVGLLTNEYADIPTFTPFVEMYPEAHVGDPTPASAEKGEQIVTKAVERIVAFLKQWN